MPKIDPSVQLHLELLMLMLHLVSAGFKDSLKQAGTNNTWNITISQPLKVNCGASVICFSEQLTFTAAKTHVLFIVIFLFIHLLLECHINASQ